MWVLPLSGDRRPYTFLETPFNAQMGKFSPDGHWVAYVSNDSGKDEIYVVPFPNAGARVQVSTEGGSQPRWRRDGRELYYLSPEAKIMVAELPAERFPRSGCASSIRIERSYRSAGLSL
jgi:eukaryotic-like serine/threonine-protein kinase